VQKGNRDTILAPRPAGQPSRVPEPIFFEGLADAKTVLLNGEDHDVFGDGTVVQLDGREKGATRPGLKCLDPLFGPRGPNGLWAGPA
jgi:hypothetical protein